jgi:hypothetical protein
VFAFAKKHPALSFFVLAIVLGATPLALPETGFIPVKFTELGGLSGSLAGVVLAVVAGGNGRIGRSPSSGDAGGSPSSSGIELDGVDRSDPHNS